MFNSFQFNSGMFGAAAGVVPPISPIPPLPPTSSGLFSEAELIVVRTTLEAWTLLSRQGMTDATVAAISTVEELTLVARNLLSHVEYTRVIHRIDEIFHLAERMGILTDADIADATTVDEVRSILIAQYGREDFDIYGSFLQGI